MDSKVAQLNLGGGKVATDEAVRRCLEERIDVLLIQEPYTRDGRVGVSRGRVYYDRTVGGEIWSAILVLNDEIGVIMDARETCGTCVSIRLEHRGSSLQAEMRELAKSLQELVQCPVCFGSLYPSYELCKNGHGTCRTCRVSVAKCRLCQQQFTLHQKSTLLNQLLERLPVICPFSERGCPVVMLNREHQEFCKFRIRMCRVVNCGWTGCVKYLKKHVKAFHGDLCYEIPPDKKSIFGNYCLQRKPINRWGWSLVTYDSQLFWKYFHRDSKRQQISHAFYHVPKCLPRSVYYFIVEFKNEDIEFSTTCKAVSSLDDDLNVTKKTTVMTLPDSLLYKFMDQTSENQYDYRYTIRVVKEGL